jgi:hypothetical protein
MKPGDPVEFFGAAVELDDFTTRGGTIGYRLLTSLRPRYQRDYIRLSQELSCDPVFREAIGRAQAPDRTILSLQIDARR